LALVIGPAVLFSVTSNYHKTVQWLERQHKAFWALWIGPALVFLWLVDSTEPGHSLVYTVALCALAAGVIVGTARSPTQLVAGGGLITAIQVALFLFAAPRADKPPPWFANSMFVNVTASGLQQHQASLDETIRAIRSRLDPADAALVTVAGQDVYRSVMYYLPEYRTVHLDPAQRTFLAAQHRHQGSWREAGGCLFVDGPPRRVAWILWTSSEPGLVPADAAHMSGGDGARLQVWEVRLERATPDYLGFKLGGDCAVSR